MAIWWWLLLATWPGTGVILVAITPSRGCAADVLFVFTWPAHFILRFLGRD
jgi:hypothetical protein